jgi:hypothetical protein
MCFSGLDEKFNRQDQSLGPGFEEAKLTPFWTSMYVVNGSV